MADQQATLRAAARVGARSRIEDVLLWELTCTQASDDRADPPQTIVVQAEIEHNVARAGEKFQVQLRYVVRGVRESGETDDEDGDVSPLEVMTIDAKWLMIYALRDSDNVSDDELSCFGEVSSRFSIHPYMRELVQGLTGRMGFPPLLLDHVKSPLDSFLAIEENG